MKKTTLIAAFPSLQGGAFPFSQALAALAASSGREVALACALPPASGESPHPSSLVRSAALPGSTAEAESGAEAAGPQGPQAKPSQSKAGQAKPTQTKTAQAKEAQAKEILAKEAQVKVAQAKAANQILSRLDDRGVLHIPLRAGSSLSARSVFLEVAHAFGDPQEFILILEAGADKAQLCGIDPSLVEAFAEERVKACFQLLREAEQRLPRAQNPALAFCLPQQIHPPAERQILSGLGKLEHGFFSTLADIRLSESSPELPTYALGGEFEGPDAFAAALLKILDEPKARSAGRWSKGSRGGFLGMF